MNVHSDDEFPEAGVDTAKLVLALLDESYQKRT